MSSSILVRRCLLSLAAISFIFLALTPAKGSAFRKLKEGEPVPAFSIKGLGGEEVAFTPDDGKVKILTFVEISQERSKKALRDLNELTREPSLKEVSIFAVASYQDKVEDLKSFVEENKISFPLGVDADEKVYGEYGLFVLPATAIIGKDGKLLFEYSSYDMEFKNIVGGKAKVVAGTMTEEEYSKIVNPPESPKKTFEQQEASRLIMLGKRLASRGMHEKAAQEFKKARDMDPENLSAKTLYGESLARSGKVDQAIKEFEEVLKKNSNFREAKIGMGIALIEKKDFDRAVELLGEASMLNPRPQRAYYWLGVAYEGKGDMAQAAKYYRKALKKLLGE